MADLTYDIARQLLKYEPETGKLFWLHRPRELFKREKDFHCWNARHAGDETFKVNCQGYLLGKIMGVRRPSHRVIWLLQTGSWPDGEVDHINGDRSDNRWKNLRCVSKVENGRNAGMHKNNTSGVNGVHWHNTYKNWVVRIMVDGRQKFIGNYKTIEEAAAARCEANRKYGYTERHGT